MNALSLHYCALAYSCTLGNIVAALEAAALLLASVVLCSQC